MVSSIVEVEDELLELVVLVVLVVVGEGQLPAWVDVTAPVRVVKTTIVTVDVARLVTV